MIVGLKLFEYVEIVNCGSLFILASARVDCWAIWQILYQHSSSTGRDLAAAEIYIYIYYVLEVRKVILEDRKGVL